MNVTDGVIVAFSKETETSPWLLSVNIENVVNSTMNFTIGPAGSSPVGQRLARFLTQAAANIKKYPFTFGMHQVSDITNRFIALNFLGDKPAYCEISEKTYKFITKTISYRPITIFEEGISFPSSNYEVVQQSPSLHNANIDFSFNPINSDVPNEYWVFLEGTTANVDSGDYVTATVAGFLWPRGEIIPEAIGKANLEIGSRITVNYLGVQAPVTKSQGTYQANSFLAELYKVPVEALQLAAEESKTKNMGLVKTSKILAVSLYKSNGQFAIHPSKSTPIGVVYKTKIDSTLELEKVFSSGKFTALNVNKEMLRGYPLVNFEIQTDYPGSNIIPFARFSGGAHQTSDSLVSEKKDAHQSKLLFATVADTKHQESIDVSGWPEEIGTDSPSITTTSSASKEEAENTSKSYTEEAPNHFVDNSQRYVKPYDDRLLNHDIYNEFTYADELWEYKNKVRIGDVLLTIPPLSIRLDKVHKNEELNVMRSRSTLLTQSTDVDNYLTLDLYINTLQEINGYEIDAPVNILDDKKNSIWYVDGLRPLLAQFKKAPFLPIDNEYINETLHIDNVALKNISIETIADYPESLKVTMVLEQFHSEAYMMDNEKLGTRINYPLLRWYYQHLLVDSVDNKKWVSNLPKIDKLSNDFTFRTVNEDYLQERKEALIKLRNMKTPSEMKTELTNKETETGAKYSDGISAQQIISAISNWTSIQAKANKKWKSHSRGFPLVAGKAEKNNLQPTIADKKGEAKIDEWLKAGIANAIDIYGESSSNTGFSKDYSGFLSSPKDKGLFFPKEYRTLIQNGSGYSFANSAFANLVKVMSPELKSIVIKETETSTVYNSFGFALIPILTEEAAKLIGSKYKTTIVTADGATLYIIPVDNVEGISFNYLTILSQLTNLHKEASKEVAESNELYSDLIALVRDAENASNVIYDTWNIPNIIPLGMNVHLENNFSSAQVQNVDGPTLQYLGGGTPKVQLSFETTTDGAAMLDSMFRQIASNIRQYREGIVSGFMKIENSLINMTGISYVLPETVSTSTVPNFPDRKMVEMVLVGFDVAQRQQEKLYKFMGANPDDELINRAFDGGYSPRKDSFYIEKQLRQLEVYPDLELPFVSELVKALPLLEANTPDEYKIGEWQNRLNQVYLDPDFYVSSEYTLRKFLKEMLEDNTLGIATDFEDASGVSATSSTVISKEKGVAYQLSDEATKAVNELYGPKSDLVNSRDWEWSDPITTLGDARNSTATKDSDKKEETANVVIFRNELNNEVLKYLEDINRQPSYSEFNLWDLSNVPAAYQKSESGYKRWLLSEGVGKELSADKVWKRIAYELCVQVGPDYLTFAPGEFNAITGKAESTQDLTKHYRSDSAKNLDEYSWYDSQYVYGAYYKAHKANKELKDTFKNGSKPTKEPSDVKELFAIRSGSSYKKIPPVPFQRAMAYFKAIMNATGSWQQFTDGKPKICGTDKDRNANRIGILGAYLGDVETKYQAQQLAWDWKYNVKFVVSTFLKHYKDFLQSDYLEFRARAFDYGILSVTGTRMPFLTDKASQTSTQLGQEAVDALRVDTQDYLGGKISPDSSAIFAQLDKIVSGFYSSVTNSLVPALYNDVSGTAIPEIYKLYTGKELDKAQNSKAEDLAKKESSETDSDQDWTLIGDSTDLLEDRTGVDNLLKSMHTDMLLYDNVGRLVRAFPSYLVQVIDEGKWYSKFRSWDNFYGTNAILSMDVYRSRKIAADTAMVSISNVYGGLTSKRPSMDYDDLNLPKFFSSEFWESYLWGKPKDEVFSARKELYESVYIETGARLHIRLGYGSDARALPVLFNGTITEIDYGDVLNLTAQGDGLELCNVISGDEDDTNKGLLTITEPSRFIGKLLTSRGNWLKDVVNSASNGNFYKELPTGISHFGQSAVTPEGNLYFWSDEYGETMQNVYSQNGKGTSSQWIAQKSDEGKLLPTIMPNWSELLSGNWDEAKSGYDEDNILVSLYGSTVWDIVQTFAYCSSDYIAAVVPFEYRSTLFFGKPHWPYTYRYLSQYTQEGSEYKPGSDNDGVQWKRSIVATKRKSFMQHHFYSSTHNIIQNNITASEEGVYPNVIVTYDGRVAPVVQADNDIRFDKQKTVTVEAKLVARWKLSNYWTTEAQAQKYGHSTVRDFMKDMYKGELIVVGDSTIKPHDACTISDTINDMHGTHLVKAVHHQVSVETGFITIIEPDAYVVNWDYELLYLADKLSSAGKNMASHLARYSIVLGVGHYLSATTIKTLSSWAESFGATAVSGFAKDKALSASNWLADKYLGSVVKSLNGLNGTSSLAGSMEKYNSLVRTVKTTSSLSDEAMLALQSSMRQSRAGIIDEIADVVKVAKKNYKSTKFRTKLVGLSTKLPFNSKYSFNNVLAKQTIMNDALDTLNDLKTIKKQVRYASTVKHLNTAVKTTKRVAMIGKTLIKSGTVWNIIISTAIEIAVSGFMEAWRRTKQDMQCVMIFPLKYKGTSLTAGINGHQGSVVGDAASMRDRWMNAEFGDDNPENDELAFTFIPKLLNFMSE
ncbi:hypothetical protein [Enterococcus sp. DIV1059_2]|uniref:hypothetical protein n=1 Tax=Enterococcus sp. DIV1059_2 TaxID=2774664 RepID=UPI003F1EFB4B